MLRPALAAIALVLLAGVLSAGDPMQAQREYTSRLISMPDTAAAHVELAKWCQAQGMADRAEKHWQEAIVRYSDCAEARAALGYVKRNMQWVQMGVKAMPSPAASPMASPAAEPSAAPEPAAAPEDPGLAQRRGALVREIQEIFSQYLLSTDDATRAAGRQRLMLIHDPAAAEPVVRILSTGNDNTRRLACEVLAGIPGEEAARLLAKFALMDESEEVRRSAVSALASRGDSRGLTQLTNGLNGSTKALERAAFALGEIGDLRTAPALITHLKTPETKVLKAPETSRSSDTGSYFFSGTITTYVANATPVVANNAVGWDLQIGAVPTGTGVSIKNPRVSIYRTIVEYVPRPAVHDALEKMLGEDHEYNATEWRAALAKKEAEAGKPQP
ncbi:MAG: HEAT repeat domain-containing protein [Planctomycetota bacterium]|nr:HEAT repeat domain-containing protein [Planctomycetota bacterium]